MQVRRTGKAGYLLSAAVLAALLITAAPSKAGATHHEKVAEVTSLLEEAKETAAELRRDAARLESLSRSQRVDWRTHAERLETIKRHVSEAAELSAKLQEQRPHAAYSQQGAMDSIMPVLKEIAENTTWAIEHLNTNQSQPVHLKYRKYVRSIYDLSVQMTAVVNSSVEYGKAKAEMLRHELGVAGS